MNCSKARKLRCSRHKYWCPDTILMQTALGLYMAGATPLEHIPGAGRGVRRSGLTSSSSGSQLRQPSGPAAMSPVQRLCPSTMPHASSCRRRRALLQVSRGRCSQVQPPPDPQPARLLDEQGLVVCLPDPLQVNRMHIGKTATAQ
jgi:hypothetical protein